MWVVNSCRRRFRPKEYSECREPIRAAVASEGPQDDLEGAALLMAPDGLPLQVGALELKISMLGGKSHRIMASARATGAELRSRLAIVLQVPEDELVLIRGTSNPTTARVADDDRPFFTDLALEGAGAGATARISAQGAASSSGKDFAELDDDGLCTHLELLRVKAASALAGVAQESREMTTWHLDHSDSLIATVDVTKSVAKR
mmetsp:Transcript_102793/g.261150  ORF Transcript_102793/g.261150 Transcript_102793/m.261150 type:complete len:204 (-) Transcript_102793:1-612(-)